MVAAMDTGTDMATAFMATGTIGATGAGAAGVIIRPGVILIRTAIGVMAGASAGTKGGYRTPIGINDCNGPRMI